MPQNSSCRATWLSSASTCARRSSSARMSASTCLQAIEVERLGEVLARAELDRLDRAVDRGVGGHQDHFAAGHGRADLAQQIEAVDVGHPQIDHREIGRLAQQRAHRLGAAGAGHDVEADPARPGARPPSAPGSRRRRRAAAGARSSSAVMACRAPEVQEACPAAGRHAGAGIGCSRAHSVRLQPHTVCDRERYSTHAHTRQLRDFRDFRRPVGWQSFCGCPAPVR